MNRNGIRQMFKKWALPAAVCCVVLAGAAARGQTTGDIVSIDSDQKNTTYTSSGTDVDIKIRLWGDFRRHSIGGIEALLPQLRLVVNGDIAWATLFTLNRLDYGGGLYKTEAVFRYRVRPGDMAQPMKIFGTSGSGVPGDSFQFYWNGWEIRNESTTSNAVWRYNPGLMGGGDVLDENFTKAKVVLRTLAFDSVLSPAAVAATESVSWRVTTVNPVETGNVVDFYVWSPDANVRLGASVGDPLLVSIPQGVTYADFPVFGEAPGVAEIFVQRAKDYQNNGSAGVTNFIKRAITVTAAPDPTVSIRMKASGTETASLAETGEFNAGSLYVDLSQPYAAPVTVRLDLSNMQAGETNVAFFATPLYVDIPAGATTSPEVFFNVPDGTVWSGGAGVMVTPVITNAAAAGVYTRTRAGRVYVQNAAPQIIQPLATDVIEVTRGEPHAFNWTVNDVLADRESGMTLSWSFGDGTSTNVSGAAGSVLKSYAINGPKVVKVTAADKDGGVSAEVQFTVNVVNPVPKPSVRVVPAKYEYAETNLVNTGRFNVYLSDPIGDDTYVRFDTYPAGQVNMLTSSGVKISAGTTQNVAELRFSLLDGTPSSELYGIEIMPVVTNAEAAAVFKDMQSATIYVNNQPPRITMPAGGVELGPIPAGVPYAFNYKVSDVAADLDTMLVHWTFSDGDPVVTVTGAVGSVSHTYIAQGTHRVIVQAEDKDGGLSPEVEFTIVVGPPPTVSVITPGNVLSESGDEGNDDEVVVRLSTTYPTAVTVNLTVTPANSTVNGILTLSSYSVTIPAGRTEWPVLISNVKDGTLLSNSPGFTVTPTIADPAVDAFYTIKEPGYIRIRNVAPYFVSHTGQTPPGATTPVVVDAVVGVAGTYSWHVWDDAAADRPTLSVTWNWADGNTDPATGASGSVTHTYTAAGTYSVMIEARDKDGGYANRIITVVVRAAKALNVTPIGPNTASYYGAGTYGRDSLAEGPNTGGGIGYGTIVWRTTQPNGFSIISDVYRYSYAASVTSAEVEAIPYRTDPVSGMYDVTSYDAAGVANPSAITDVPHDSFFLCWDGGTEEGLAASDLNPATASAAAEIALAAATDGGTAGAPATDPEIRRVRAIFSREWIATDYDSNQHPPTISLGDINKDGIPDGIAVSLLGRIDEGGDAGGGEGTTPAWLDRLDSYNNDLDKIGGTAVGDFYPVNPLGVGGTFDFRPTGAPFNCFKEIRGDHEGLNYYDGNRLVSVPFGPEDEPGTDPTLADTDDDMLPDGWEYWFWRAARFGFNDEVDGDELTGEEYNPLDVAKGIFIPSRRIETGFNPAISSGDTERDFDNDGLKDVEELLLGTNPTHWDTDGDGICDGWEFLRNLNPLDPSDAALNLDGDHMAYALVERKLLTVVLETAEESVTNMVLCVEEDGPYTYCYRYGADDGLWAAGLPYEMPVNGVIITNVATKALLLHFQVAGEFGFDPRTAWTGSVNAPPLYDRFPSWVADTPNTKPFTALDEYLLLKFMSELRLDGAADIMLPTALVWERYSTHPLTPDSDITVEGGDGMPDGWELYVAIAPGADLSVDENRLFRISPWNHLDGALDHPVAGSRDSLVNRREFAGTDSSAAYSNPDYYNMTNRLGDFIGNVSITYHDPDIPWINKFWPSNPWSTDTDGDGLSDSAERTFIYGAPGDSHTTCTQGGGLNPNASDTDFDGLPDAWEREFAGTMPEGNGPFSGIVIADGMDGTVKDEASDWDFDGLKNYQEYWVQAVRAFRYDIPGTNAAAGAITGNPGLPMDIAFQPNSLFTEVTNMWDLSRYPWGDSNPNLWIMLPVGGSPKRYVSTDPRDWDTDKDGMDDYYELFHGLNPILGNGSRSDGLDDRVGLAYTENGAWIINWMHNDWYITTDAYAMDMDFVRYPWLAGMPSADPDADGLLNLEEALRPDTADPQNYNTDPSPLWMTDRSSPQSVVSRFYYFGGDMFFWPGTNVEISDLNAREPFMMFSFEENEGYDTDNDGVCDKIEMSKSATASSSPLDHDDPVRRQALWFDGAQSAAQTLRSEYRGEWALRSFTVELWACPETVETAEGQILIERPIKYLPSDVSTPGGTMRRNFRIGIEPDGRVYAMFDNAGAHDEQTGFTRVEGRKLLPNQWVHLAASMDGANGKFTLLVTHPRVSADEPLTYETYSEGTDKVPANGILTVVEDQPGTNTAVAITYLPAPIVLGSALNETALEGVDGWPYLMLLSAGWSDYSHFFRGYIDEVRVWDGARTEDQIRESRNKRFNRTDLLANRLAVRKAEYSGASRMPDSSMSLPAELMYHYTFDNLFGADRPESVAKAPRGFNHPDTADNRPAGYEVGWWSSMPLKSEVYDDYSYVPWIENGTAHLPLFSRKGLTTDELYPFVDMVLNSVFWSHTKAGDISKPDYKLFHFPNDNNPYGMWYEHHTGILSLPSSGDSVVVNSGDMLPLGNAFARRAASFWDSDDPGSVWAETGEDTDADGLPDWWEAYVATQYPGADLGWDDLYPDGSGMTAGERYLRDLRLGWTETNNPASPDYDAGALIPESADIDRDGLPDWWENLYNLKVESQIDSEAAMYSPHGGMGDPDRDGLSSYAEYLISEDYAFKRLSPVTFRSSLTQTSSDYFQKEGKLYFGQMFTDHDFMEDSWEDNYHPYYVSRFVYDAHLDYDGDGWSNWAECRFGGTTLRSDPSLVMHDSPEEFLIKDFPVPLINARLRYDGLHREANTVVIHAFSDPDMNGQPDAVFTAGEGEAKAKYLGLWGPKSVRGVLSPGAVKPGSVRVRFTDNTPRPATTRLGYYWSVEARSVEAGSDSSDPASGDDRNGFIRIMNDNGMTETVGTINYLTGEYEIDFAVIQGWVLGSFAYDGGVMVAPERDVNDAYIVISYEAAEMPGWPKNLYLSDADLPGAAMPSLGYVKEGFNYFFAFLDLDGSGQWSAGEPCGVSESFAVDVGWDRQTVNIYLTDYRPGFLRIDLNSGLRSEDIYLGGSSSEGGSSDQEYVDPRVVILRTHVDGFAAPEPYAVVDKTMTGTRSYLHEGDLIGRNQLGFDWALLGVSNPQQWNEFVYEVRRGASGELVSVFTNIYDTVRAKAVATYPANAYVYSARPEFRWRMPAGYTAFAIEIKKSSPAGATVYSAEPVLAPARNPDGEHIWRAPICANTPLQNGQVFTTGTVYYWRVMALNSKFSNTALNPNWSDWKSFRLDVNRPIDSSGYGEIRARIKYYGPAASLLTGRVKVRVFDNEGFAGWPEAEYTLAGSDLTALTSGNEPTVNAVLRGLVPSSHAGNYYVMAYIDHNQNGDRDAWESWGYANHYGLSDKPYDPRAVSVAFGIDSEVVDIVIEDADTDQDWFPDAWEFEANPGSANFLGLTGPATGSDPDTEINPTLSAIGLNTAAFFLTMSTGTTDQDGDGLGDLLELALGTDANVSSSADDGYLDGDKVALGFDPNAFLTLNLTGLDLVSDTAPTVSFDFGLEQPETEGSALLPRLSSLSAEDTREYEILYKQSLSDADWTVLQRGSVPVSGLESVSVRLEDAVLQNLNPGIGFFRIRLPR